MLQRIYGTCFPSQQELDEYLKKLEEAKLRDHRKIGKEMDLFDIFEHDEPQKSSELDQHKNDDIQMPH